MAIELNVDLARGLTCALLILAGPIAVAILTLIVDHHYSALMGGDSAGPVGLVVAWCVGLLGVHRLPIGQIERVIVAIVYAPLAVFAILMTGLMGSCMLFHDCI